MQEGLAVYSNLGVLGYGSGISTTQNAQYGEVWDTLGIVEDRKCCLLFLLCTVVRTCHLVGFVLHFGIIISIVAFHIHRHIGNGYGGMFTISTTEYREMRIVVVVIRFLPFFCVQKVEWSHTFLHFNKGSPLYVAGKITATIDIMRIQEMFLFVYYIAGIERSAVFTAFWIPFNETIFCIPNFIPDDVDGEAVLLLSVIAFLLSTHILCQGYVGIACNVGIGEGKVFFVLISDIIFSILICDVTLSTAEYLSGKVGSKDVDIGISLYLCQTSTAIDIAVDIRCLLCTTGKDNVGAAFYQTYGIRSLGIAVVVLIRKIVRAFRTSVTASEDRTTDVCAIADNHVGSIIFILALIFYHRHIATSIDVLVESAAIDGDVGLAIDASHIREGRDGIGAI